ncbi:uncharacterized protein LOC144159953 [Haemaphysalis longicornis]
MPGSPAAATHSGWTPTATVCQPFVAGTDGPKSNTAQLKSEEAAAESPVLSRSMALREGKRIVAQLMEWMATPIADIEQPSLVDFTLSSSVSSTPGGAGDVARRQLFQSPAAQNGGEGAVCRLTTRSIHLTGPPLHSPQLWATFTWVITPTATAAAEATFSLPAPPAKPGARPRVKASGAANSTVVMAPRKSVSKPVSSTLATRRSLLRKSLCPLVLLCSELWLSIVRYLGDGDLPHQQHTPVIACSSLQHRPLPPGIRSGRLHQ